MLAATLLTLLFVPVFYAVIERLRESRSHGGAGASVLRRHTPEPAE
jgi:HAE1 family hydrophobic/amphiphilic exporter-1